MTISIAQSKLSRTPKFCFVISLEGFSLFGFVGSYKNKKKNIIRFLIFMI